MALIRTNHLVNGLLTHLERDADLDDEATRRCKRHLCESRAEATRCACWWPSSRGRKLKPCRWSSIGERGQLSHRGPEPDAFERRRERSESDRPE
ncbi:hypothetical protein C486_04628 [Natrinema gari JCM 14663]|uniref:Uncharacterized protein n=1 Tax=Natrinema gari JCM 14663 TaxID=1230459 RepID=L9Z841_9EURY|nr:hypothetical protein C486_04628 [Natrinema gari JCM 14663]